MSQQLQQPLSVGVWLSVKKWNEMKSRGLFDPDQIMSNSSLLAPYLPTDNNALTIPQCPVVYHQLSADDQLQSFDVIMHKNSETMANALFFQITSNIQEYSTLLRAVEECQAKLPEDKKITIIDPFDAVEKTLDRCAIYNYLMKFLPVGDGELSRFHISEDVKTEFGSTPLHICLPPSVLLYQPSTTTSRGETQTEQFASDDIQSKIKSTIQQPLLPEYALSAAEASQYPLFFDHIGDGMGTTTTDPTQLKPSIVCIKSPLSSGSAVSHAMVLSHNAHSVHNQEKFQTPQAFIKLPPGLHLLTHVSPHNKVYKVYVIGDVVEIECRDSIDINGIYFPELLQKKKQIFEELCKVAINVHYKLSSELYDDLKTLSDKYQQEYCDFERDLMQRNHSTQSNPAALYFNSQYMHMHMYNGSTPQDLLHTSETQPVIDNDVIKSYLEKILNGTLQPLLSLFPNTTAEQKNVMTLNNYSQLDSKTPPRSTSIQHDQLYPTISSLHPNSTTPPIKDIIQLSQRTVTPPYLPNEATYQHADLESHVTSSDAWKQHIAIRKLLKQLWTVEEINQSQSPKEGKEQKKTTAHVVDVNGYQDELSKDFRTTVQHTARFLQKHIGLSLFGFDVVVNSHTNALTIIDVNYFPSYTAIHSLPTRVALEVLKHACPPSGQ